MTNEEAIKWLTLQKNKGILWDDYSDETKGIRENAELRIMIAYEMAIEALEQKSCEDCISRADVIDLAKKGMLISNSNYQSVCKAINELPSVTPTRKKMMWEFEKSIFDNFGLTVICPSCRKRWKTYDEIRWKKENKYCPNCGARMTESEEKE